MTKFNNKGFFLIETVVVVGIIATILVLFYSQISTFYRNYERNANYNTVESIHAVHNIKTYIIQNYTEDLITDYTAAGTPLFDITSYDFDITGYYAALISDLNIKKVYFSLYNINTLIANYADYDIDAQFIDYLKTLKVTTDVENTYRIIVILNDNTYSNILLSTAEVS